MLVFTYYAAVLRLEDRTKYYFVDFPDKCIEADDPATLSDALKQLIETYVKHFHAVPPATGIAPMLYKVKKWLREQGLDPNVHFLSYQPVRAEFDDGYPNEVMRYLFTTRR